MNTIHTLLGPTLLGNLGNNEFLRGHPLSCDLAGRRKSPALRGCPAKSGKLLYRQYPDDYYCPERSES
ncbi:MAG: hypothetical protein A3K04_02230 [Gallionellales bacterium RBG_16_56_9]|nr:MAG: hypothetical protein A3K04_02230 [Gallionellales bacterium RBG_16_56_9]